MSTYVEDIAASWDAITDAEPEHAAAALAVGVRKLRWVNALTSAIFSDDSTAGPDVTATTLGYAQGYTFTGFDFETGRQTVPKSPTYLEAKGKGSKATWKRHVKALVDAGWLTQYGEVRQSGTATPMYLLTIPSGSDMNH